MLFCCSTVVDVDTKDPFVAKVAQQYLDYLKLHTDLDIELSITLKK